MPEPWEPQSGNESWSDRDAWRGDTHGGDDESWRGETSEILQANDDAGWVWGETDDEASTEDMMLEDWPEDLAGPEYWLYKRYGM
jgi:hypothetical protein